MQQQPALHPGETWANVWSAKKYKTLHLLSEQSPGYTVRMPSVMTYTLVVMSSIERYIDTDVCAICVMNTYSGCDVKYGG